MALYPENYICHRMNTMHKYRDALISRPQLVWSCLCLCKQRLRTIWCVTLYFGVHVLLDKETPSKSIAHSAHLRHGIDSSDTDDLNVFPSFSIDGPIDRGREWTMSVTSRQKSVKEEEGEREIEGDSQSPSFSLRGFRLSQGANHFKGGDSNSSRGEFHLTNGWNYRDRLKSLNMVAKNFFLLLCNCSAWTCLGPAQQNLHTFLNRNTNTLANPKVHCLSGASCFCSVHPAQQPTMQTAEVAAE